MYNYTITTDEDEVITLMILDSDSVKRVGWPCHPNSMKECVQFLSLFTDSGLDINADAFKSIIIENEEITETNILRRVA